MDVERSAGPASTRRGFLGVAAGVSAGVAAASFHGVFGIGSAVAAGDEVTSILSLAATAEALAVTCYYATLTGAGFLIDETALDHFRRVLGAELHHLQILRSLGGQPLQQRFSLPDGMFTDARIFAQTAICIETALTGAYLTATQRLASLGRPALAATAAQLGAGEAQHLTLISHLAGLAPSGETLPGLDPHHMPATAPTLAPFLRGGAGFGVAVACPTASACETAIGNLAIERVQPFAAPAGAAKGQIAPAASLNRAMRASQ